MEYYLFYFIFFIFIFFISWWECKLVQPLWKTVWRFLKKLEILFILKVLIYTQFFQEQNIVYSKFIFYMSSCPVLGTPQTVADQAPLSM